MENNGLIVYMRGNRSVFDDAFFELFLLEELNEWEVLEIQDRYHTEPSYIERCSCDRLYLASLSTECLRCEKLRDNYD